MGKDICSVDKMIYTRNMREAVHRIPVPHKFVMDIIEFSDSKTGFLLLRYYSDQWYSYTEEQRADCAEYMQRVKDAIGGFGTNVSLDPVIGSPS